MRPTGILETALYCPDLDAAERFYSGVLGLHLIGSVPDRHRFYRCGDGVLLLFRAEATEAPGKGPGVLAVPHGGRGPGHMAFRATADELEAWRAHLSARGVDIEAEVEWPGGGRSLYFRDPAGNSLEFAMPEIWGIGLPPGPASPGGEPR